MKKIIGLITGLCLSTAIYAQNLTLDSTDVAAGGATTVSVVSGSSTGTIIKSASPVSGFVQTLELITGYAAQTCSVWIVTAANVSSLQAQQTIYSNSAVTASTIIYPHRQVHNTAGSLIASTNALYSPIYLSQADVWMYCWNSTATSNTTIKAVLGMRK